MCYINNNNNKYISIWNSEFASQLWCVVLHAVSAAAAYLPLSSKWTKNQNNRIVVANLDECQMHQVYMLPIQSGSIKEWVSASQMCKMVWKVLSCIFTIYILYRDICAIQQMLWMEAKNVLWILSFLFRQINRYIYDMGLYLKGYELHFNELVYSSISASALVRTWHH